MCIRAKSTPFWARTGAGKSTLIKILAGIYPPTEGRVRWKGQDVAPGSDAVPITFIHQDLGLVDTMTVAENVAVLTGYPRRSGLIDWRAAAGAARAALDRMGSRVDPETRVGTLSAADKSIVAIARALACRSDLLVLDEPTAALPAADVERLLDTLVRLKASGIGLIYVTHRLDEVFRIADRLTVLRDGRRIATRAVSTTSPPELVDWIVGGALAQTTFAATPASDTVLLQIDGLVVSQDDGAGRVGPVSLTVRRGETLGLVGLRGAGHHAPRPRPLRRAPGRGGPGDVQGSTPGDRQPVGGHPQRHRFRVEPPRGGKPGGPAQRARKPLHELSRPWHLADAPGRSRSGTRRLRQSAGPVLGTTATAGPGHRHAQRRQPAEGRGGPLDGIGGGAADPRRADDRRRCGLEGGDLPRSRSRARARPGRSC